MKFNVHEFFLDTLINVILPFFDATIFYNIDPRHRGVTSDTTLLPLHFNAGTRTHDAGMTLALQREPMFEEGRFQFY